jgi:Protein of unknown function (DUF3455)
MQPIKPSVFLARPALLSLLSAGLLSACDPSRLTLAPDVDGATGTIAQPTRPARSTQQVPAALQPGDGERAVFTWHAIGTQIYECRSAGNAAPGWVFVAPEADLFKQKNEKVGTHGAGPHWAALDGSKVVGSVKTRAEGASAADIPLLLLSAKADGAAGKMVGKMVGISSVQCLNTAGGVAPATGCQSQADVGKRVMPAYSADYVFFAAK